MRSPFVPALASVLVAGLLVAGCASAAPSPTPAPAAPKAADAAKPTAPASAQPTTAAAPAKKVDFPQKGKAISIIVPFGPGGGNDLVARVAAPIMEKQLGTAVEVVNKAGAGGQVGITELSQAKPDGYTIGYAPFPAVQALYMNPERKAVFTSKSFAPVALQAVDLGVVAVRADSPYKNMQDLVQAAKANPKKVKISTSGLLSSSHLMVLQTEKAAGIKFAVVHFADAPTGLTNLLGGHVDAVSGFFTDFLAQVKAGEVRLLGIMDKEESSFAPGVKTMEAQGYKLYGSTMRALMAPAGTPPEVVDILSAAVKKAVESDEHKKKASDLGIVARYMNSKQLADLWNETDTSMKPIIEQAIAEK